MSKNQKIILILFIIAAAAVILAIYFRREITISTILRGQQQPPIAVKLSLTSANFQDNDNLAAYHTCDGVNYSPVLNVSGVAPQVQSLALIMEDLDAPAGVFTHWLVWNIKTEATEFPENSTPYGGIVGTNDFGKQQYSGPCPPRGDKAHKYQFVVYALDSELKLDEKSGRKELTAAMNEHILDRAFMTLYYKR